MGKGEAIRQKKKLEADMNELSIALEHANGSNTESQATIKKYQNQIKAAQMSLEEEQIMRDKAREGLIQAERNHHAVATQLEHADRQRRGAEQELSDVMEQLSDCTLQNQALQTAKRKLDSEMQTLRADLEEMICESRIAEDKAKKAMIDAARLADELRGEQENAQHCEEPSQPGEPGEGHADQAGRSGAAGCQGRQEGHLQAGAEDQGLGVSVRRRAAPAC